MVDNQAYLLPTVDKHFQSGVQGEETPSKPTIISSRIALFYCGRLDIAPFEKEEVCRDRMAVSELCEEGRKRENGRGLASSDRSKKP